MLQKIFRLADASNLIKVSEKSVLNRRFLSRFIYRRSYFNAVTPKKFIHARLREKPNGLALETWESHEYYRKLSYLIDHRFEKFPHNSLLQYFQAILQLNSWAAKFSITSNGIIIPNLQSPVSSEYVNALSNLEIHQYGDFIQALKLLSNVADKAMPDLLYAIPKEIWDSFIAKLPYQDVVASLNLSVHRHLWRAYNYVISATDSHIRKNRAICFGGYHFLLSFLNPDGSALDPRNKTLFKIQNPYLPYVSINYASATQADIEISTVFASIDKGEAVINIFKNYAPYLTRLFINRFSHCPRWEDLIIIGSKFIVPKATSLNGSTDKQKLDSFIADLPSSKDDPFLFSNMLNDSKDMDLSLKPLPSAVKSHVFYQSRHCFGAFKKINCEGDLLRDYLLAITSDLIFPELIRQINIHNINVYEYIHRYSDGPGIETMENFLYKKLTKEISIFFTEKIAFKKLLLLEKSWHKKITIISDRKPTMIANDANEIKWRPLFQEQIIDNVSFICLTTPSQLREESNQMHHCVRWHAHRCVDGLTHIVRVVSQTGERCTLELKIHRFNNHESIIIEQSRTRYDAETPKNLQKVCNKLIKRINNGEIKINVARGVEIDTSREAAPPEEVKSTIYPYIFENEFIQEQVYQAYKTTGTLPAFMQASTYREALQKSGLEAVIKHILSTEVRLPTNIVDVPARAQLRGLIN